MPSSRSALRHSAATTNRRTLSHYPIPRPSSSSKPSSPANASVVPPKSAERNLLRASQVTTRRKQSMEYEVQVPLREDFLSFVRKAFREKHGEKLGKQPYIDYLCSELSAVATG